jgi:NADPH:quinone reductase-like Zn-dependent oxidoreductase
MRALCTQDKGGPELLQYSEVLEPFVGIGDVRLRVKAASFTPDELEWPPTWVDRRGQQRRPVIPGHEVSGVVEELGYGTTGVSVGDQVYGLTDWYRDGAAAEVIAVEARNLAPKPTTLDHAHAAAVPMPGLTAWQALFEHGGLSKGQTVLIHGAGGGVGTYAVELARWAGAGVVATGRARSADLVSELGAQQFVDVEHQRFEQAVTDVDVVLDLVGGETLARSASVLKPGGVLVSVAGDASSAVSARSDVRGVFFIVEPRRSELRELGRLHDEGVLRSVVGEVVALSEGRRAFESKGRGGISGKVVLAVG